MSVGLLVGPSVRPTTFVKKWTLEYWKVSKTYLPTYLWNSSNSSEICDSSDISDSSDSSDKNVMTKIV